MHGMLSAAIVIGVFAVSAAACLWRRSIGTRTAERAGEVNRRNYRFLETQLIFRSFFLALLL